MFWPWNLNAGDLLGLPKKAAAVIKRSDLNAEVKLRPGTVLLLLLKRELGHHKEAYRRTHPHCSYMRSFKWTTDVSICKRKPSEKTYSWDWPFTCTYCSIVLCFDVRSTWEIYNEKKWRKLDRSFCMIWVELFSYVSVMHVYLSFYFGYSFPKWKFLFIVLLIVTFLFWFWIHF